MTEADSSFSEIDVELYDALVDWPKRLANEEPFYRQLFDRYNVKSVLDVACGTGHHAGMFHSWSLRVEGADLNPKMIDHCRKHFGKSKTLDWQVRPFDESHPKPGSFDAAVCVGNSLSLAGDYKTVKTTVAAMLEAVKTDGLCIIHVLNLWRMPEGPTTWQKCKRVNLNGKDHIVLKGIHRVGSRGFVDLIDLDLSGDSANTIFDAPIFLALKADNLSAWTRKAGGKDVQLFGNYSLEPYDRKTSQDLILVATRG